MSDIASQPEFMRLGEIDLTLSEFMPLSSGDYDPEYLPMDSLSTGYTSAGRSPHQDYMAMGAQEDYLMMGQGASGPTAEYLDMSSIQGQPRDDYLAMSSDGKDSDNYCN